MITTEFLRQFLQEKSPALSRLLKEFFNKRDMDNLYAFFYQASLLGALREKYIERQDLSSFNPKPARLAHILVKTAGVREKTIIGAGFFACVSPDKLLNQAEIKEIKIAYDAIKLINNPRSDGVSRDVLLVSLALALDEIRHLHIMNIDMTKKFCFSRMLLNEYLPGLVVNKQLSVLTNRIQHACKRYE